MIFDYKIFLDGDDTKNLCNWMIEGVQSFQPDIVIALGRGGFVPGVYMSHGLGIPMEPVMWQTRDGGEQTYSAIVDDMLAEGRRVVICDDINDSGRTFKQVMNEYSPEGKFDSQIKTCCMVEKVSSQFKCDVAGMRIDDPRWIVFDWETIG